MRRFGGKFDEFKSSIKFDSRFLPRFRVFSGVKFDEAKLTMLKFTCKFYSRVFCTEQTKFGRRFAKAGKFCSRFLAKLTF
ncbi:hypothetical protein [Campylobacter concisus]|uniref:hypothetical protein n=1 Tax=Campylobacter concisus TaxID=199 RepID=UPI00131A6B0A|nr:hypothetical protein [Campylobacter concisus]